MNDELIMYLSKIKSCVTCQEKPVVIIEYATKIRSDGKVETAKATVCLNDWAKLANSDISWSCTP